MVEMESVDPTAWEPLPTYMELLQKTVVSVHYFAFNSSNCYSFHEDFNFGKSLLMDVPRSQVLLILAIMATLTVTRALMSAWIFEPLSRWLRMTPSDSAKFPESAWKLLVYSILWTFSFEVVVISARHDYLQRPTRIWNFSNTEDHYSQPLPGDIYWMYILQISFYLHSIYATLYMDVWRKDSMTMLFHHGITIFLLQFSFLIKYHKIGSLVLFIHDISDVFLEFTKINVYLKHRGRRFHVANDILSSIGFVAFAGSWAFFRLYWFPLKVLYSSTWGVYIYQKGTKGPRLFFYFNLMLWLLLALHIYWFWFILVLLYRIATGQMKELDDTREYDSGAGSSGEESAGELASGQRVVGSKSKSAQNGSVRQHRRQRSREANGFVANASGSSGDGVRQRLIKNGSAVNSRSEELVNGSLSQGSIQEILKERELINGHIEEAQETKLNGNVIKDKEFAKSSHDEASLAAVDGNVDEFLGKREAYEGRMVNGGTQEGHLTNGEAHDDNLMNGEAREDHLMNGEVREDHLMNGEAHEDHLMNGEVEEILSVEEERTSSNQLSNGSTNHSKE